MEELKTGIAQYDGEELRIYWSVKEIPKPIELKRMEEILRNTLVKLIPQLRLSMDQMKLVKVLTKEYGEILGYEQPEMQDLLKEEFCELY